MKLPDHIIGVFTDAENKRWESAFLHALIGIDATAKALYPSEVSSARRYIRCIREYYWLIEPMMGVGFNLVDTRFGNVTLKNGKRGPDFAELVYHIHRCNHAHGDEVPIEFSLTPSPNAFFSTWEMAPNSVKMPDKVIWALTSVAVFSRVNYRLRGQGDKWRLSWGNEMFPVSEWWGREAEVKLLAVGWNTQRIELAELHRLNEADPETGEIAIMHSIAPPPFKPS